VQAIGIDIGGTKIAGALVDESGALLRTARRPTAAADGEAILDDVAGLIAELAEGTGVRRAGVAAPGFIDRERTTVRHAPNIDWRGTPVRDRLRDRLPGFSIALDNDANAAGWAEHRYGAGRGAHDMVLLTIGTGVGGAVIADGRLLRGGFGAGGELGHLRVVPDGRPCGCGAHGCLEQYASGRALLRLAAGIADAGGIGRALALVRAEHGELRPDDFRALAEDGDPGALAALRELGGWIGQAAATLTAVLDPELFVIGGGVSVAGEQLLAPVREACLAALPARGTRPEPRFAVAELGNDAGVVGAADLARRADGAAAGAD